MKVTKDNLFDYLRGVIIDAIPDSKYIRVLLPEVEYKDIRSAIEGIPPVGDGGLIDNGRTMVNFRGVKIEFVCDYLTDDEELTYVLLENEMLRGENDELVKLREENKELTNIIEMRRHAHREEVSLWVRKYYSKSDILVEKLEKIPTFIRKIFGA